MMKSLWLWIFAFMLLLSAVSPAFAADAKIGVLMWHETVHDNEALEGFKEGMYLSGAAYTFDIKRGQGDETACRQYIRRFKAANVDLIFATGTNGALWAMEEVQDIPIVFSAVTHPVLSGIADSWERSGRNVTGSSNWINLEEMMKVFRQCLPTLNTLGVIYNADNPVPTAEITEARAACQAMKISLKESTIQTVDEIEPAIEALLAQGIDALWVPRELLVYRHMSRVGRMTLPAKLPVFSSTLEGMGLTEQGDTESVALVAMTVDYKALGRLSVSQAIDILVQHKDPKEIPISMLTVPQVVINADTADRIGYVIPPAFLARASRIIHGSERSKIVVAGTGDCQELLRTLADALETQLQGGKIDVPDSIGSGGGIKAVLAGQTDLARVARPLKAEEEEKGLTYRLFAKCPVVFVVHPSVDDIDHLTTQQILDIYSGRVTRWREVGSKQDKIYPVTREAGDSSLKVLAASIPEFDGVARSVAKVFFNTPSTVEALVSHRNTIGFLPLSATVGTKLRIMKIDGVYPSIENVNNGAYAMVVPYGIVYKDEPVGLARRFVDFLYSEQGQAIIRNRGAVPAK